MFFLRNNWDYFSSERCRRADLSQKGNTLIILQKYSGVVCFAQANHKELQASI